MHDQITVRLPSNLRMALRRASRRLRRRDSDIVRMALESFLQERPASSGKPADRVRHLIGSLESGVPDLAEDRGEYVISGRVRLRRIGRH